MDMASVLVSKANSFIRISKPNQPTAPAVYALAACPWIAALAFAPVCTVPGLLPGHRQRGCEEFLQAMADPGHPEHEEMKDWSGGAFDSAEFNVEDVQQRRDEIKL